MQWATLKFKPTVMPSSLRKQFNATSILVTLQQIFYEEIRVFQAYVVEVTSQFESKSAELSLMYKQHIEEEWQNALEDELMKNAEYHPKILNSSVLITLQTLMEKTLLQVIRRCANIFGQPVSNKQTYDLENMIATLETKFGIQIPAKELAKLDNFRKIRNFFVHYGGNIFNEHRANKAQEIRNVVSNDDRLILNEHTRELIIYDNQYLISYSANIQQICNAVFDQLIAKHNLIFEDV